MKNLISLVMLWVALVVAPACQAQKTVRVNNATGAVADPPDFWENNAAAIAGATAAAGLADSDLSNVTPQTAGLVFAGPSSGLGGPMAPTFRTLSTGDLPSASLRQDESGGPYNPTAAPFLVATGTGNAVAPYSGWDYRALLGVAPVTVSANTVAVVGRSYIVTGSATITDPSQRPNGAALADGDLYAVTVLGGGLAEIGGDFFASASGAGVQTPVTVTRSREGGAWVTRAIQLGSAAALNAGTANGVATLDGAGKVPSAQLPSIPSGPTRHDVDDDDARLALLEADIALGDIVREGEEPPYIYYMVVDPTAAGTEDAFTRLGGTAGAVPPARTSLAVSEISDETAFVAWANPSSSVTVTGVRVSLRTATGPGPWVTQATLANTATTYELTNLTPATDYDVRVVALSDNGTSDAAIANFETAAGWDPSQLAGLKIWLESDYGLTADGSGNLDQWLDRSPKNAHGVPTIEGAQVSGVTAPDYPPPAIVGGKVQFEAGEDMGYAALMTTFEEGWGYTGKAVGARVMHLVGDWPEVLEFWLGGSFLAGNNPVPGSSLGAYGNCSLFPALGGLNATEHWKEPLMLPTSGGSVMTVDYRAAGGTKTSRIVVQIPATATSPGFYWQTDKADSNLIQGLQGALHPFGEENTLLHVATGYPAPIMPMPVQVDAFFVAYDDPPSGDLGKIQRYLAAKYMPEVKPFVLCFGNSLTKGYTLDPEDTYPVQMRPLLPDFDVANVGINSRTHEQLLVDEPNFAQLIRPGVGNVMVIWEITNTINGSAMPPVAANTDAEDVHDSLVELCEAARGHGWKVVVVDCIGRRWDGATQPDKDAKQAASEAVNALVAANWESYADRVVRLSLDARLTDPDNTTYFESDGTHLTAAGYGVVASLIAPVVEDLVENP